jgi:hypothetical protein
VHKSAGWETKRARTAQYLASGWTIQAAASKVKVSVRAIHNWLQESEYKAQVSGYRGRLLDRSIGQLVSLNDKSISVLEGLLNSEVESIRLRAALGILDQTNRARERGELEERIAALENQIRELQGPRLEVGENGWGLGTT